MKSLSVNDKKFLLYSMCPATLPSKLANWVPRSIFFARAGEPEGRDQGRDQHRTHVALQDRHSYATVDDLTINTTVGMTSHTCRTSLPA